jgi:hypothetical protein
VQKSRAEEHLALFYPDTEEEYDALFRIMLKKSGLQTSVRSIKELMPNPHGLSGADIEAILARAALISDAGGADADHTVSPDVLRHTFEDFIPASSPLERELQILVAVQECTSREVLPETYRNMDRSAVQSRINELRILLNS